jgi:hypothetical protein
MLKTLKQKRQAIAAGLSLIAVNSFAAVPATVTTAITDATADGQDLGWKLAALAVAVGVVFYLKRKAG